MLRLKQVLVVLLGLGLAAGMVALGRWQLDVYNEQGLAASAARAAGPAVELATAVPAGGSAAATYGRSVVMTGTYEVGTQFAIPARSRFRIVTGLRQTDGSLVAVVRGLSSTATPPPPTETVRQTGVLLPSEDQVPAGPDGQPGSVRISALAQTWPGPLIDGVVTLRAEDAVAQGLEPDPLILPESSGRLRNGAYAIQWWVFAAFAVAMAVRTAREMRPVDEAA